MNRLKLAYHSDNHHLIQRHVGLLNEATRNLAENIMNTAVSGALKGTHV